VRTVDAAEGEGVTPMDLIGGEVARERIERVLRGEDVATPVFIAGSIPAYYGVATAAEVCDFWLRMWRLPALRDPVTASRAAFYQAGAIGWASRS
jgi:hypothetical protein